MWPQAEPGVPNAKQPLGLSGMHSIDFNQARTRTHATLERIVRK